MVPGQHEKSVPHISVALNIILYVNINYIYSFALVIAEDPGRKIMFDNVDLYVQQHEMTEENQNKDLHWVTVISTENWVSQAGHELIAERTLPDMDNAACLPDKSDHRKTDDGGVPFCHKNHTLKFINFPKIIPQNL